MKKIVLSVSLALAQLLAVSAIAQVKGEVDPAQSKAIPSAPATPAEKAAAKAARKAEGKTVAPISAGAAQEASNKSAGTAKKATKAERKAAAAKRKAEAKEALKKGEIPSGDKPVPEPKK
jgi:hypothetical protein